jgi:hypothetical protein
MPLVIRANPTGPKDDSDQVQSVMPFSVSVIYAGKNKEAFLLPAPIIAAWNHNNNKA